VARLVVRVQPGARTTKFNGWYGEHPRLAVAAPPVDGAANEAARRAVADAFDVQARHVRIVIGAKSRTKHFEIDGIDQSQVEARLHELLPDT
jgi:uncharacterized protein YggU (UPF0235/DUF167 family)